MWSAIRSDLKEFVSSVADDGNTVLTKIDDTIKDLDKDDESNLSYADDLSDVDTSGDISQDIDSTQLVAGDNYIGNSTGYEATGIISEPSDEAMRRMGLEETYTIPLLKDELSGTEQGKETVDIESKDIDSLSVNKKGDEEGENLGDEEGEKQGDEEEEEQDPEAGSAKVSDVEDESNGSDKNEKEIKDFLKSFDIQAQTEEISKILTKHPDVGLFFETLVPVVVTYEQFWQRYFYRCNVQRIKREWDEEEERVRLERQEMIDKGVKSVKNMFGGALKAFKGVANQKQEPKKASIYEKYQAELKEQQRAMVDSDGTNATNPDIKEKKGTGLGFFGSGRPPFALNTAGSGDDDEEYIVEGNSENEEDDDEDDELGWESDEEEDESDESDEETDDNVSGINNESLETEIVFGSPTLNPSDDTAELAKLREELSQVVNERDKLKVTLENQSKAPSQDSINSNGEIQRLKMSLFEKDSELAALKASLHDTQEDNSRDEQSHAASEVPNQEIELLSAKLSDKDNELNRLQLELDKVASAKKQIDSKREVEISALKEANERVEQLSVELEDTKKMAMRQSAEVEDFKKAVGEANLTVKSLQETQLSSEQTINELTARAGEYESSRKEVSRLKAELDETRVKLEQQKDDFTNRIAAERAVTAGSISPQTSTSSSVVNVAPQPVEQNLDIATNATNEEDDDWGDAWSEGDD